MKILHVAGARPNFMKVAPVVSAMQRLPDAFDQVLVHTGQHYDYEMSQVFFNELDLPEPDEYLNVGSGSHAEQTARLLSSFEPVLLQHKPDWIFVYGDVNSTMACALVGAKLRFPVAHIESGLRSFDRSMPEEINRLLTDQISDLLFTPSLDANHNLQREGISANKIHLVGNVMIDSLVRMLPAIENRTTLEDLDLEKGGYILVTLHRPANVDEHLPLIEIMFALQQLSKLKPVIFPVHPRTRERITRFGIDTNGIRLIEPQGYLDFMAIARSASFVLTDSGGVQEETTYLGIPCLTLRPNTERPVTISMGTNRLVPSTRDAILEAAREIKPECIENVPRIPFWDGHTADRIVQVMLQNGDIFRGNSLE